MTTPASCATGASRRSSARAPTPARSSSSSKPTPGSRAARMAAPGAQAVQQLDVVAGVERGERRALARLITLLESEDPKGHAALQSLHKRLGKAHVIGVTGSPGTGKSTLVD